MRGVIALSAGAVRRRDIADSAAGARRRRRGPACGPDLVIGVKFEGGVVVFGAAVYFCAGRSYLCHSWSRGRVAWCC